MRTDRFRNIFARLRLCKTSSLRLSPDACTVSVRPSTARTIPGRRLAFLLCLLSLSNQFPHVQSMRRKEDPSSDSKSASQYHSVNEKACSCRQSPSCRAKVQCIVVGLWPHLFRLSSAGLKCKEGKKAQDRHYQGMFET